MKLISSILFNPGLLPAFVRYYRSQGVTRFHLNIYSESGLNLNQLDSLPIPSSALQVHRIQRDQFNGLVDSAIHDEIRRAHVDPEEWYVVADLDEFHHLPGGTLGEMAAKAEGNGWEYYCGPLIDRVTASGVIPETISMETSLGEQFPIVTNFTKSVLKGCVSKVIMAKGSVKILSGHHFAQEAERAPLEGESHHFKWQGDMARIFSERLASYRNQGLPHAHETNTLLTYLEQNNNRIDLSDPRLEARQYVNDPIANVFPSSWSDTLGLGCYESARAGRVDVKIAPVAP